jgi:hypothetical protein
VSAEFPTEARVKPVRGLHDQSDNEERVFTDFHVSLIPIDVNWRPITNAATEAEAYVRREFPDPDGSQEINVEFCDRITTVAPGRTFGGSAARSGPPSTVSLHCRPNILPRCSTPSGLPAR